MSQVADPPLIRFAPHVDMSRSQLKLSWGSLVGITAEVCPEKMSRFGDLDILSEYRVDSR